MKQSISLITLAAGDYEASKAFYAALGWVPALDIEAWEVAHNPGFGLDDDGRIVLPSS